MFVAAPPATVSPNDWGGVRGEAIEPAALFAAVSRSDAGAVAICLGTVRDHSEGHAGVTHLEYEAYREVVEDKIREIVGEVRDRWEIGSVAAAHRPAAFAAAQTLIDELKHRAPIWKKEHWPGGAEWVQEGDAAG